MEKYFTAKRIAFLSVFTAAVLVTTMFVKFPNPVMGYTNFGDAFILLGAMCFGPVFSMISGGIGSALADVISGYAMYAPFTLLVKGLEGFIAGILLRALLKARLNRHAAVLLSAAIAACEMILGYFLTNAILYGGFASATGGLLTDGIQGAVGVIGAYIFTLVLAGVKDFDKYTENPLSRAAKKAAYTNAEEKHDEDHPSE